MYNKEEDGYLRTLLIHGARAVIRLSAGKNTPLAKWIERLIVTRGRNKAAVALANKFARVSWAILRHEGCYDKRHLVAA